MHVCREAIGKKKAPTLTSGTFFIGCLAVTYFRIRMHTIIGATSFHGPVRDGKGWVQSAMTAKRNFYRATTEKRPWSDSRIASNDLEEVNWVDYIGKHYFLRL